MPPTADRSLNKMVLDAGAVAAVTPASAAFHRSLPSADLHADSMWWTHRNLRNRDASVGHVDIPRLLEGSIALQCFSIVTKTPAGLNFKSNTNKTDVFGAVAVVQRWPVSTWTSLMERALFQVPAPPNASHHCFAALASATRPLPPPRCVLLTHPLACHVLRLRTRRASSKARTASWCLYGRKETWTVRWSGGPRRPRVRRGSSHRRQRASPAS